MEFTCENFSFNSKAFSGSILASNLFRLLSKRIFNDEKIYLIINL